MSILLAKTFAATALSSELPADPVVRTERAPRRLGARRSLATLTSRASGFALFHDWSANKAA
ncbi:hypothetical protein E6W36_08030 [Hankyongella ginsenosidimutans]|uniref:Uncharacterized protein n=1 Tax=Hankyongella ginsenosidimutans TaxID=1763828 RepID=A0A4D7C6L6_9SPHN|nr:hypothetical protein [Hankyongella ginsenosidimutans]QCI79510.1 hypothetical protein E6W36_08030 [Hankyongella ginsenosidimutans]TXG84315.1 MAG: hypothetical protein E6R12_04895 [Sphingomonadales bacterium]